MSRISGATKVAGILGWPAAHSLSPAIHNAAFAAADLDWVYVAFEVPPDSLEHAVAGARALGLAGLNVTMPHKRAVIPLLDGVSSEAERAGAVNTIINESGKLIGGNSDGAGFVRFMQRDAAVSLDGAHVLLLGAGGAARSLAVSLSGAGASVAIAARNLHAAQEVAQLSGAAAAHGWDSVEDEAGAADVIVNATPVGAHGEPSPVAAGAIPSKAVVVDLIYSPAITPLMVAAREAGAVAHNGVGMLLHQAVLAFELWTGVPAPEEVMSAALVASIGRAAP